MFFPEDRGRLDGLRWSHIALGVMTSSDHHNKTCLWTFKLTRCWLRKRGLDLWDPQAEKPSYSRPWKEGQAREARERERERKYGNLILVLIKLQLEIKCVNHSAWKKFLLSGLVMQSTPRCVWVIN